MDLTSGKAIIENFKKIDFDLIDSKRLILSGGEPLLHPDFFQFLEAAEGIRTVIASNGILIQENLEKLRRFRDQILIQLSLDGSKENHEFLRGSGTFDRLINTLRILKKSDFSVAIKSTLHRKNIEDIPFLLEIASSFQFPISFNYFIDSGFQREVEQISFDEYSELIDRNKSFFQINSLYINGHCFAGIRHISVTPDLRYISCPALKQPKYLGKYPDPLPFNRKLIFHSIFNQRSREKPDCLSSWYK